METPILTKKQQKISMSGKKKKETIKNILVTPFKNFWPLLSENDAEIVQNILKKNLVKLKHDKANVPWKDLKGIPRIERKDFRKTYSTQTINNDNKHDKAVMLFGINEITRALENDNVTCILITSDVQPQLMVKHIIDMAVLKNKPTLIVPNLRSLLRETTGITSVVFAFKQNVISDHLLEIIKTIIALSKNYHVPKGHINYERGLLNMEKDTLSNIIPSKIKFEESESDEEMSVEENDNSANKNEYYLYRKSKTQRVFIPDLSVNSMEMKLENTASKKLNDFLSFEEPASKKQKIYKSLKVNRIRNNNDRNNKKLEMIKWKK